MITSNTFYPFGGKVSTVETPSFNCLISTAKAGIFKNQSVMFFIYKSGLSDKRHVATLEFTDAMDKAARLAIHDPITKYLDQSGIEGTGINETLMSMFKTFENDGIGRGLINRLSQLL